MGRIADPGYVVQRNTRLNGVDYVPGDPAPDGIDNAKRLVRLGILAPAPATTVTTMATAVQTWDPTEATVEQALAFLAAHPEELERVRAAEQDGKARTTLLDELEDGAPVPEAPHPGTVSLPPPADPYTPSTALRAHLDLQGSGSASVQVDPDEPSGDTIDPGAHPVAVVIGWVNTRPDQAEALLEAERAGKGRVTLVEHLERLVGQEDPDGDDEGGSVDPDGDTPAPEPLAKPLDPASPGPKPKQ